MLLTTLSASAYNFIAQGIYYNITGTDPNTVEVTYRTTNYNSYSGNVTIPSSVTYGSKTYQVTAIGNSAFYRSTAMTSVTLPNTVTSIGTNAFNGCTGLATVTIPGSVTNIGSGAFYGCSGLTRVNCLAITPPVMANTNVFDQDIYNMAELYVPYGCRNTYKNSDGWSKFRTVETLNYSFEVDGIYYGIKSDGTVKTTYYNEDGGTYSGAVNIPSSVTYQGVTYPVAGIGDFTFSQCVDLTAVTMPSTVTYIEDYAFASCSGLTSIAIPNSVEWFGEGAFRGCTGLTSVTLPSTVDYIPYYAFGNCSGLTSVNIPNSVTAIEGFAFTHCTSLTSVRIPSSVTNIGERAFQSCTSLIDVICLAPTPPTIKANTFDSNTYTHGRVVVSQESFISAYQADANWGQFTDFSYLVPTYDFAVSGMYFKITGTNPRTVAVTSQNTDYNSYSGTKYIPSTVTFNGNTYTVTSIGDYAFYNCTGLTRVLIPSTVTFIGDNAFTFCPLEIVECLAANPPSLGNEVQCRHPWQCHAVCAQSLEYEGLSSSRRLA